MIATELGRKRHSVRDVRRTVRQGLWLAIMVSIPIWLFLWQAEPILIAMGQEPRLAAMAGSYVHTLMWASLPFHAYLVLRSFISALERPRWALIIVFSRGRLQRLRQLVPDVRQSRLPGARPAGLGRCDDDLVGDDVRRHGGGGEFRAAVPALPAVRALLARRLAASSRRS